MKLIEAYYMKNEGHYIIYDLDVQCQREYPCYAVLTEIPKDYEFQGFLDGDRGGIYLTEGEKTNRTYF